MQELITSRDNARVKYLCAVGGDEKLRCADGVFFAEGPKLCLELAKSCKPAAFYVTEAALAKTPALAEYDEILTPIMPHVAEKLAETRTNQGVFALFAQPAATAEQREKARRILALEGVQDPGNVGTLLRSAAAFGFDAVLLGPGCAAPFAPKTLRASMGAAGRLPLFQAADLPAALGELRERGVTCLASALYRAKPLEEVGTVFEKGVCVVVGSEGQGLTDAVVAACDAAVRIPMTDQVESLNAGVAGSVLLWHFRGV